MRLWGWHPSPWVYEVRVTGWSIVLACVLSLSGLLAWPGDRWLSFFFFLNEEGTEDLAGSTSVLKFVWIVPTTPACFLSLLALPTALLQIKP